MKFTVPQLNLVSRGRGIATATGGTMRGSQWVLDTARVSEIPNGVTVDYLPDGAVTAVHVDIPVAARHITEELSDGEWRRASSLAHENWIDTSCLRRILASIPHIEECLQDGYLAYRLSVEAQAAAVRKRHLHQRDVALADIETAVASSENRRPSCFKRVAAPNAEAVSLGESKPRYYLIKYSCLYRYFRSGDSWVRQELGIPSDAVKRALREWTD